MAAIDTDPRRRLIDVAAMLMTQHGYEAVGVADLCRAADVRKGSFYHFFESKQALALEVLDQSSETGVFAKTFDGTDRPALATFEQYGHDLADKLNEVEQQCGAVVGCRIGNFAVELSVDNEIVRARVTEILEHMREGMAETIRAGVESGELSDEVDPSHASLEVLAQMEGLMVLAKANQDPELVRGLGDATRRLLSR